MKGLRQYFNELSEVHAFVCDIVEDGFIAVSLILHVSNFHLQTESLSYLTALYHRVMFTTFGLLVFAYIYGLGYAVDALDVIGRL